jgi:hypothetical protein
MSILKKDSILWSAINNGWSPEVFREISDNWDRQLIVPNWKRPKRHFKKGPLIVAPLTIGWVATVLRYNNKEGITQEEWLVGNRPVSIWHLHLIRGLGACTIARLFRAIGDVCPKFAIWLVIETQVSCRDCYQPHWWTMYERELNKKP